MVGEDFDVIDLIFKSDIEKYYKKQSITNLLSPTPKNDKNDEMPLSSKKGRVKVNLTDLQANLGLQNPISSYHPMDKDQVRRAYLQKGPYRPRGHKFPYTWCGQDMRRFNPFWFKDYGGWLEYNIEKDAAFCMCCYLFGEGTRYDAFITQ